MVIMGKWKRNMIVMMLLICLAILAYGNTVSSATTKKITMNLAGAKTLNKHPAAMDTAKKVTVKSSNKSVITVKYKKARGIRQKRHLRYRTSIVKQKKLQRWNGQMNCISFVYIG